MTQRPRLHTGIRGTGGAPYSARGVPPFSEDANRSFPKRGVSRLSSPSVLPSEMRPTATMPLKEGRALEDKHCGRSVHPRPTDRRSAVGFGSLTQSAFLSKAVPDLCAAGKPCGVPLARCAFA